MEVNQYEIEKKALSLVMTGAMIVGMFAGMTVSVSATSTEYTGQTTTGDYTISTPEQLTTLATKVNAGYNYQGSTFTMTTDITAATNWQGARGSFTTGSQNSSPTIASGTGFAGTFDGGGNTLTVSVSDTRSVVGGLFGFLESAGTVKNLIVTGSVSVSGSKDAVAGVVGYNSGTIQKVINRATVTANSSYNVGGITGFNNGYYGQHTGIITNCGNEGSISGYSKIGGIAGENSSEITGCYNYATITNSSSSKAGTGGIVGRNGNNNTAVETGMISNCYNRGYVNNNNGYWGGGIAGFQNSLSSVTNCYNTADTYHTGWSNPIVGKQESSLGGSNYSKQGLYASGTDSASVGAILTISYMQSVSFSTDLNNNIGTDSTIWSWNGVQNDSLPYLSWQSDFTGTATDSVTGEADADPNQGSLTNSIVLDGRFTIDGYTDSITGNYCCSTLATAITKALSDSKPIYITGVVTIASGDTVNLNSAVTIYRDSSYMQGYLFIVDGTFNMSDGVINGQNLSANAQILVEEGGLFNMTGGTIRNADGMYEPGSGIRVCGGTLTITGGTFRNLSKSGTYTKASAIVVDRGSYSVSGTTVINCDSPTTYFASGSNGTSTMNSGSNIRLMANNPVAILQDDTYTPVSVIDFEDGIWKAGDYYLDESTQFENYASAMYLDIGTGNGTINIYVVGSVTIPHIIYLHGNVNIIGIGDNAELNIIPLTSRNNMAQTYMMSMGGSGTVNIKDISINAKLPDGKTVEETSVLSIFIQDSLNTTYENVVLNGNDFQPITAYWCSGGSSKQKILNGVEIKGFNLTSAPTPAASKWGVISLTSANTLLTIKGLNVHDNTSANDTVIGCQKSGDDYVAGTLLNIEPTAEVIISKGEIIPEITITSQDSYPIQSVKIDGRVAKDFVSPYSLEGSTVKESLQISNQKLDDEGDTPVETTYTAYFVNASENEIAKDGTFTADVYMKSDEALSAGELNLACENGTITSAVAGDLSTDSADTHFEYTNNKMSFYENTASAKDGVKIATVTVQADGSGKDVVLSIVDGMAAKTGSITDTAVTLKEEDLTSVTVPIVKNDKVSCTEYAAGKYLIKYTGDVPEGSVAVYNGGAMLWSPAYEAWISLSDTDVSGTISNADITTDTAGKEDVSYEGDVNGNGKVNIVDAQIAYDIASRVYSDYSVATMQMWMSSDVNKDALVSALDARRIQCLIHGIEA